MTARARELKGVLNQEGEVGVEELVRRGVVPREVVYEVEEEVRARLGNVSFLWRGWGAGKSAWGGGWMRKRAVYAVKKKNWK